MDTVKLKNYLSRIAQLEAEKRELDKDILQVYHDAEGDGIEICKLKAAVKLTKMKRKDRDALTEMADILE